jgi:hypothetical protein
MSTPDQHFDAARKFQAYYDDTLRKVGMRAPQPVLGETVNHYRRETLRIEKNISPAEPRSLSSAVPPTRIRRTPSARTAVAQCLCRRSL